MKVRLKAGHYVLCHSATATLLFTRGRRELFIQTANEILRDRRHRRLAAQENVASAHVTVDFLVRVVVWLEHSSGNVDPREETVRAGVRQDLSAHLRIGRGLRGAADGSCCDGG